MSGKLAICAVTFFVLILLYQEARGDKYGHCLEGFGLIQPMLYTPQSLNEGPEYRV